MSRSIRFILLGSVWTLTTVLFAAGLQVDGGTLFEAGWLLASLMSFTCCLALGSAVFQSSVLRSTAFICHLLLPLSWTMWVCILGSATFEFGIWGLVSLMGLVGAVMVEHGLEVDFELVKSGESALRDALRRAAEPLVFAAGPLDTGSLTIRTL
ncbi:MAG: hypothetical protein WC314_23785 [Vulcanimicrobiota bacterium]